MDELTGRKTLDPKTIPADIHIQKCEYVGNYAIRIDWSDRHNTGIYSFRFLRDLHDMAKSSADGSAPAPGRGGGMGTAGAAVRAMAPAVAAAAATGFLAGVGFDALFEAAAAFFAAGFAGFFFAAVFARVGIVFLRMA